MLQAPWGQQTLLLAPSSPRIPPPPRPEAALSPSPFVVAAIQQAVLGGPPLGAGRAGGLVGAWLPHGREGAAWRLHQILGSCKSQKRTVSIAQGGRSRPVSGVEKESKEEASSERLGPPFHVWPPAKALIITQSSPQGFGGRVREGRSTGNRSTKRGDTIKGRPREAERKTPLSTQPPASTSSRP